ncbi:MAG: hypothetical protein FJX80_16130 [Bacteroidetes bacterium]|nr:hypothetical protein [Bacteroidota bacterium]
MILKVIPYLLIVIPIIGFFYTPEPPPSDGNAIHNIVYFLFLIPLWGKILSIIIGILWIASGNENKEKNG